jgi:hypothetical protein
MRGVAHEAQENAESRAKSASEKRRIKEWRLFKLKVITFGTVPIKERLYEE